MSNNVVAGLTDSQKNSTLELNAINKLQNQVNINEGDSQYFQFHDDVDITEIGNQYEISELGEDSFVAGQDIKMPSSANFQSNNNIFLGDEIEIQGSYNIVLADDVKSYNPANPDDHIDWNLIFSSGLTKANLPNLSTGIIMISPGGFTDNGIIPSGSIILGAGAIGPVTNPITPSEQPKLQFGGGNLLSKVSDADNGGFDTSITAATEFIRIRYKDENYTLALYPDDNADNPNP